MYLFVAGLTYGKGFTPHFPHQYFPIAVTSQVFQLSDMVHTDIVGFLAAQFTNAALDSGRVAVWTGVLPDIFWKGVGVHQHLFDAFEAIMVKFTPFCACFGLIWNIKYPVLRIPVDDFPHRRAIFAGEGFIHAALHDMGKFAQHRHIVCQPVIVVESPDFRIEFSDDFNIGKIDELATAYRFPDFFSSFVILDFNQIKTNFVEKKKPRSTIRLLVTFESYLAIDSVSVCVK